MFFLILIREETKKHKSSNLLKNTSSFINAGSVNSNKKKIS